MASLDEAFDRFPYSNEQASEETHPPQKRIAAEDVNIDPDTSHVLLEGFKDAKSRCASLQQELTATQGFVDNAYKQWTTLTKAYAELVTILRDAEVPAGPEDEDSNAMDTHFKSFQDTVEKILHATSIRAAEKIADRAKDLASLRGKLDAMLKLFECIKNESDTDTSITTCFSTNCLCPVCYDRPIATCNIPCGHTQCTQCQQRQRQRSRCPMCSTDVRDVVRLYFSA